MTPTQTRTLALLAGLAATGTASGPSAQLPATQTPETGPTALAAFHWADFDADGLEDAFVVTPTGEARLLKNRGEGTLEDITGQAGLSGIVGPRFALWADFDLDLDLDLFVATEAGPGHLLSNDSGVFSEISLHAGLSHQAPVLFGEWIDYDNDGAADLHVHTAREDLIYRNVGGVFEAVSLDLPRNPAQTEVLAQGGITLEGELTTPVVSTNPAPHADQAPGSLATGNAPGTRVPVTGRTSGVDRTASGPGGGVTGLGFAEDASPPCAFSVNDQAIGGGCLMASSTPTLGMLYPMTANLFVSPAGMVGMGTTLPSARLDVNGMFDSMPVRAVGQNGPTLGYLAPQGATAFDGIASANWSSLELGVAGISVGGSSTDNYGVMGHATLAGVRGEYSLEPTLTYGELGVALGIGVLARGSLMAAQLYGDVDVNTGDVTVTNGQLLLDSSFGSVLLQSDGGDSGALAQLSDSTGQVTIELDGDNGGGSTIEMFNDAGLETVEIDSDLTGDSVLYLRNASGNNKITLDGGVSDGGADLLMAAADGSTTLFIDADANNDGALISVRNDISQATIELIGDSGFGNSGEISMYDRSNGSNSVVLRSRDSVGSGGELLLTGQTGNLTVDIDGDQNGFQGGSFNLYETDGSLSCDIAGTVYTFHDDSGVATWSFNRLTGTDAAVVGTPTYGNLEVYGMRSTENWFEDFGTAMLVDGVAHVQLDPMFLEAVTIDAKHPMKVFVTLNGASEGVWVEKDTASFMVFEQNGGSNTLSFDYRIVAKRRGVEATRLASHDETLRKEALLLDPVMQPVFSTPTDGDQLVEEAVAVAPSIPDAPVRPKIDRKAVVGEGVAAPMPK